MSEHALTHIVIPAEIIAEILSNLDAVDLLTCRLVSKSWNEHCLYVLKNKKPAAHHVKLDTVNIQSFLDFVTLPSSSRLGLMPSFPWKFELNVWEGSRASGKKTKLRSEFKAFDARVDSLLNLLGPECVDKFTLTNSFFDAGERHGIKISRMATFFVKLGAGLTQVIVEGDYCGDVVLSDYESKPSGVKLPKLKTFKFSHFWRSHSWQSYTNVVDFFCFENMDTLEEFNVDGDYTTNYWYERFDFSKLAILELGTIDNAPALLDGIRLLSPSLPILQKLSFGICADTEEVQVLAATDILAAVGTTLTSLTLNSNWTPSGDGYELLLIPLLPLPHLKNFRIDVRSSDGLKYCEMIFLIDPVKYHFNPYTLPALESVDLPITTKFKAGQEEFPNVTHLTLRTFHADQIYYDSDYAELSESFAGKRRQEVEELQKIFPNVRSLTVVKESLGVEENQVIKHLLLGIMKSSQGAALQELVIRNGDEEFKATNFLGEIFEELSRPPLSLTLRNMGRGYVTKSFEGAVRGFLRDWAGFRGLAGTEVMVASEPETGSGDKLVAFTIKQRSPTVRNGIQNVTKIRLEQFSSNANEEAKWNSKPRGPRPLSDSEQRTQLV